MSRKYAFVSSLPVLYSAVQPCPSYTAFSLVQPLWFTTSELSSLAPPTTFTSTPSSPRHSTTTYSSFANHSIPTSYQFKTSYNVIKRRSFHASWKRHFRIRPAQSRASQTSRRVQAIRKRWRSEASSTPTRQTDIRTRQKT